MTSLMDIGPLTEEIPVGGNKITVYGITPEGLFYLMDKFPILQEIFGSGTTEITMDALRDAAPESVAYALATATTSRYALTNKQWRDIVEVSAATAINLGAHYQMALFQAALRLTFPEGIGPFMMGLEALIENFNKISGRTAPVTTSSKPSRSGFVTDSRGMRLGPNRPRASSTH